MLAAVAAAVELEMHDLVIGHASSWPEACPLLAPMPRRRSPSGERTPLRWAAGEVFARTRDVRARAVLMTPSRRETAASSYGTTCAASSATAATHRSRHYGPLARPALFL